MAVSIKNLDEFAEWIEKLEYRHGQWHAVFFPGKVVQFYSIEKVVSELLYHVLDETIVLCVDALDTSVEFISENHRKRMKTDYRLAISNVLSSRFKNKIRLAEIGHKLGWANHCMVLHAESVADVAEVDYLIRKIYKKYPFLQNGYKGMKP